MKYLSLFSGIGGFELGIQKAYEKLRTENKEDGIQRAGNPQGQSGKRPDLGADGLTCIGYSEIDKYAIQVYEKHFKHKNYGDIKLIDANALPDFDLVVGGFPCQSFSIAGKRGGFGDSRGTLFFEIARILKQKQPRLLLLENVKGLLSHDQGNTFRTIIATLDELGYDLEWQVLNSKNFGVPQNRERVFIIGHLGGFGGRQVFPIGGESPNIDKTEKLSEQISNCLRTNYSNGKSNETYIRQINNPKHSNERVYDQTGISPTLNTMQGGLRQPFVEIEPRIRRLTPTECMRLQGFPDDWCDGISDTQKYKCAGNAVTVNVIKSIMERILD